MDSQLRGRLVLSCLDGFCEEVGNSCFAGQGFRNRQRCRILNCGNSVARESLGSVSEVKAYDQVVSLYTTIEKE